MKNFFSSIKKNVVGTWRNMSKREKRVNIITDILIIGFSVYTLTNSSWGTGHEIASNLAFILGTLGTATMAYKFTFTWGVNFIQNILAIGIGWNDKLIGDMFMSMFYAVSEFFGYKSFKENTQDDGTVKIEQTSNWVLIIVSIVVGFFGLGIASIVLGGRYIFLDSLNNSTAIVAQALQIKRKKSSYYLWMITDVIGFIIWAGVGNFPMAMQQITFALNTVRGLMNWNESEEEQTENGTEVVA